MDKTLLSVNNTFELRPKLKDIRYIARNHMTSRRVTLMWVHFLQGQLYIFDKLSDIILLSSNCTTCRRLILNSITFSTIFSIHDYCRNWNNILHMRSEIQNFLWIYTFFFRTNWTNVINLFYLLDTVKWGQDLAHKCTTSHSSHSIE